MGMRRVLAAAGTVVLVAGGLTLAGVSPASADQVWHQSVGRSSANGACVTSSAEDLAAGWSQWSSSWEQWANDGKGGYTCTRSITWALEEPTDAPASAGRCTLIVEGFFVLDPSGFIPFGAPIYDNESCTPPEDDTLGGSEEDRDTSNVRYGLAWTSGGQAAANAICQAGNSSPYVTANQYLELELEWPGDLYFCEQPPG